MSAVAAMPPAIRLLAEGDLPVWTFARALRAAFWLAQDGWCPICGERLTSSGRTLDHVVPRSRGGAQLGNLLVVHNWCNLRKADRMPTGCELIMLAAVNARVGLAAGMDL